jgi:hypothetical protein
MFRIGLGALSAEYLLDHVISRLVLY